MMSNLFSDRELSVIKVKLSLDHRTEDDWVVVKDLLRDHDIVVMEPKEKNTKYKIYDHILFDQGGLLTFTSIAESQRYITFCPVIPLSKSKLSLTKGAL